MHIICLHKQNIVVSQSHEDFIYLWARLTRKIDHVTPYFGNEFRARMSTL